MNLTCCYFSLSLLNWACRWFKYQHVLFGNIGNVDRLKERTQTSNTILSTPLNRPSPPQYGHGRLIDGNVRIFWWGRCPFYLIYTSPALNRATDHSQKAAIFKVCALSRRVSGKALNKFNELLLLLLLSTSELFLGYFRHEPSIVEVDKWAYCRDEEGHANI